LIELSVFLIIYLSASAITLSIRKRCEEEEGKAAGFFSCGGHLIAFILRPLAVLAITEGSVAVFLGACGSDRVHGRVSSPVLPSAR
jgi:hypothetical protein